MIGPALLALALVGYALLAQRLERRSITGAIVFMTLGLVLGPAGFGVLDFAVDHEGTLRLTEVTLALLLFADASTVPLRDVRADARLPGRLLGIGLPLTILAGALVAAGLFPHISLAGAALIATILAPTDAALGLAVVTNRAVPVRIRRALNVESGLNDGIATPFVALFLSILLTEEIGRGDFLTDAVLGIGLAVVVAIVVGAGGGWAVIRAKHRGWTSPVSEQLAGLGLALLAYSGAVAIGGNGFVAAFAAGIAFGATTSGEEHSAIEFTEHVALVGSLAVWAIFGSVFVGAIWVGGVVWPAVLYAVLSLTVIRMVPVALALVGQGFRPSTVAFIGWFGPRGLASVVFTLLAVETLHGAGGPVDELVEVASWTILLSVVLHGLTAGPVGAFYGRIVRAGSADVAELVDAPEPKMRKRAIGA